jgi:transposase, IS5 family
MIGHSKAEHRMGRNYLAGAQGDSANAVLAAAGYNFRRLLARMAGPLAVRTPDRPQSRDPSGALA